MAHATCPRRTTARTAAGTRCTPGSANWDRGPAVAREAPPDRLYAADDAEVCLFLRHLWATDGCVWLGRRGKSADEAYYATSSRELADGVAHLLARLGIVARGRQVEKAGDQPGYHVIVADGPSLRTFCERVGVHGRRGPNGARH